jgi:hypothetical protein
MLGDMRAFVKRYGDRNRRVYALEKHGDTEGYEKIGDELVWSER